MKIMLPTLGFLENYLSFVPKLLNFSASLLEMVILPSSGGIHGLPLVLFIISWVQMVLLVWGSLCFQLWLNLELQMDGLFLVLEQRDKFFSTLSSLPLPCHQQMILRFGQLMVFLARLSLQKLCGMLFGFQIQKDFGLLFCGIKRPFQDMLSSHGYLCLIVILLLIVCQLGVLIELDCLLCGLAHESRNHLFFGCVFSAEVWRLITQKLGFSSPPILWDHILFWLSTIPVSKYKKLALLQGWQGAIYELWRERNRRFHDGLSLSPVLVAKHIISTLENKGHALNQLGFKHEISILQCWIN